MDGAGRRVRRNLRDAWGVGYVVSVVSVVSVASRASVWVSLVSLSTVVAGQGCRSSGSLTDAPAAGGVDAQVDGAQSAQEPEPPRPADEGAVFVASVEAGLRALDRGDAELALEHCEAISSGADGEGDPGPPAEAKAAALCTARAYAALGEYDQAEGAFDCDAGGEYELGDARGYPCIARFLQFLASEGHVIEGLLRSELVVFHAEGDLGPVETAQEELLAAFEVLERTRRSEASGGGYAAHRDIPWSEFRQAILRRTSTLTDADALLPKWGVFVVHSRGISPNLARVTSFEALPKDLEYLGLPSGKVLLDEIGAAARRRKQPTRSVGDDCEALPGDIALEIWGNNYSSSLWPRDAIPWVANAEVASGLLHERDLELVSQIQTAALSVTHTIELDRGLGLDFGVIGGEWSLLGINAMDEMCDG